MVIGDYCYYYYFFFCSPGFCILWCGVSFERAFPVYFLLEREREASSYKSENQKENFIGRYRATGLLNHSVISQYP